MIAFDDRIRLTDHPDYLHEKAARKGGLLYLGYCRILKKSVKYSSALGCPVKLLWKQSNH